MKFTIITAIYEVVRTGRGEKTEIAYGKEISRTPEVHEVELDPATNPSEFISKKSTEISDANEKQKMFAKYDPTKETMVIQILSNVTQ